MRSLCPASKAFSKHCISIWPESDMHIAKRSPIRRPFQNMIILTAFSVRFYSLHGGYNIFFSIMFSENNLSLDLRIGEEMLEFNIMSSTGLPLYSCLRFLNLSLYNLTSVPHLFELFVRTLLIVAICFLIALLLTEKEAEYLDNVILWFVTY